MKVKILEKKKKWFEDSEQRVQDVFEAVVLELRDNPLPLVGVLNARGMQIAKKATLALTHAELRRLQELADRYLRRLLASSIPLVESQPIDTVTAANKPQAAKWTKPAKRKPESMSAEKSKTPTKRV